MGCSPRGRTESDMTEVSKQQSRVPVRNEDTEAQRGQGSVRSHTESNSRPLPLQHAMCRLTGLMD